MTYQDQLSVLAYTTKAVAPTIPPEGIEAYTRDECGVALTSRDDTGFTSGKDGYEIVLASDGDKFGVGGPGDLQ